MSMVIIMYALGHATSLLLNIGMFIADVVVTSGMTNRTEVTVWRKAVTSLMVDKINDTIQKFEFLKYVPGIIWRKRG
jgi:hypothetical protein